MQTFSSAKRTGSASASTDECTATDLMPSSRQARITRSAISPRFAINTFLYILRTQPWEPWEGSQTLQCSLRAAKLRCARGCFMRLGEANQLLAVFDVLARLD